MNDSPKSPLRVFLALSLACALGLAGYLTRVRMRMPKAEPPLRAAAPAALAPASAAGPRSRALRPRHPRRILFRYNGMDRDFGKLAVVEANDLSHPRFIAGLSCEVVYFAGGRGVCLTAQRGMLATYALQIFDSGFHSLSTIPVPGFPSRCRVSRDGRLAAFTMFVSGHSYADHSFSTRTLLVDTSDGKALANVEDFSVERDGHPFQAPDFNFWGVTFTPDSKHFYCTLATNQRYYLVKGDIAARSAAVIYEDLECPSLSPDATRIAHKKRVLKDGKVFWKLAVLDLATLQETPLAEEHSVDDQLEWLDNGHVLYSRSEDPHGAGATTDVWQASADGRIPPRLFLQRAYSPSVVR
jgi:hypothetical protein